MATLDHWVYYGKYDNEPMRYDDCFGCHEAYGVSLQAVSYTHLWLSRCICSVFRTEHHRNE